MRKRSLWNPSSWSFEDGYAIACGCVFLLGALACAILATVITLIVLWVI